MINQAKNKEMQPSDSPVEARGRGDLYCVKECEIPGVGHFNVGDAVTDHDKYVKLKDHPFFSNQAPEAK